MRYSELIGKEIVDVSAGTRLGLVAGTDLVIDTLTGSLEALVVFRRSGWFSVHEITVPWHGVKKVGKGYDHRRYKRCGRAVAESFNGIPDAQKDPAFRSRCDRGRR